MFNFADYRIKVLLLIIISLFLPVSTLASTASYGIAMHGEPKYPSNFTHFDYVNPSAPKGGKTRLASIGSGGFDSLNSDIVKGVPASGLSYIYDTLTVQADDEPFTRYGLIAEKIEVPDDRSWVIFHLNPKARFHDGHPITAEDVVFTFNLLVSDQAHPHYRYYYEDVEKVEAINKQLVRFSFKPTENRELPLVLGGLHVLPKHYWKDREFNKTTLEPPLGSGPYKITHVKASHSVTYERVKDYWAKDLPVNKGRYNFDTIIFDHYRDATVALEALKAGEYDLRHENVSRNWATAYDSPIVEQGLIIREELPHENSTGMQGFVFNIRKWPFENKLVRQALAYAYDFEWTNEKLQYGAYIRTNSYFSNTELAARELPSNEELAILAPYKDKLPQEVFTKIYQAPATDGSGNIRANLKKALTLLKEAGWELKNKKLIDSKTNKPMKFEFLIVSSDFKRIIQPIRKNLERLGVETTIRLVDYQQYVERRNAFDFDVMVASIGQSLSPGNEQRSFWSSKAADMRGSQNIMGIKNPVIDKLLELVISAPDREQLVHRTRALDRVLLWHHYIIPHYHIRTYRLAYWDKFGRPDITPKYHNFGFNNWWVDNNKVADLAKRKQNLNKNK